MIPHQVPGTYKYMSLNVVYVWYITTYRDTWWFVSKFDFSILTNQLITKLRFDDSIGNDFTVRWYRGCVALENVVTSTDCTTRQHPGEHGYRHRLLRVHPSVFYLVVCTHQLIFILHITTDLCTRYIIVFVLERTWTYCTYASRCCERCSHETISSMRHFRLLFFRKHTCARLPPVTHPPTPRTCRQPAGLMWMNKKRILSGKQSGVPLPPWPSILVTLVSLRSWLIFVDSWWHFRSSTYV